MSEIQEHEIDARISRIVGELLRQNNAPLWRTSGEAAAHLRMSKHHFLRLCRMGAGPESAGAGRLKRWRLSDLDRWQSNATRSIPINIGDRHDA